MKRKWRWILSAVALLIVIASIVSLHSIRKAQEEKQLGILDQYADLPGNGELFYAVNEKALYFYNEDTNAVMAQTEWKNGYDSVVVYPFSEISNLYTIGDSFKGDFSILKTEGNQLYSFCKAQNNQTFILPVAATDQVSYFDMRTENGSSNLYALNQNGSVQKVAALQNLSTPIYSGTVIDGWLYYTVYMEKSDTYTLYKWNTAKANSSPEKCVSGLDDGHVFRYKNKPVYSTHHTLVFGKYSISLKNLDVSVFQKDHILLIFSSGDGTCTVYNLNKGKEVQSIDAAAGFALKDGKLVVYTYHSGEQVVA